MIFVYSRFTKTKIFAEGLSDVLGMPFTELECDLNERKDFNFMFKALRLTISGKTYPVKNLPVDVPGEIWVCSPIWGGRLTAPVKYFLQETKLTGVKVNILLTANSVSERYRKNALKYLSEIDCIAGEVHIFQTSDKFLPEREIVAEHLRLMLENND